MIARAAILAEGADFAEVMTWITEHEGAPEATVAKAPEGGLHGERFSARRDATPVQDARRWVLPPGALTDA